MKIYYRIKKIGYFLMCFLPIFTGLLGYYQSYHLVPLGIIQVNKQSLSNYPSYGTKFYYKDKYYIKKGYIKKTNPKSYII